MSLLLLFGGGSAPVEQTGSFGLDAVLRKEAAGGATLDAIVLAVQPGSGTLDAVLKKEATGSFGLDSYLLAVQQASATLDAVLLGEASGSATLDAIILAEGTDSAGLDAVVMAEVPGAAAIDAVVLATLEATAALEAVVQVTQTGSASLDALLVLTVDAAATLDAVLLAIQDANFGLDAVVAVGLPDADNFAMPGVLVPGVGAPGIVATFHQFGLDAIIFGERIGSFGLDAFFDYKGEFALDAIVLREQPDQFGLEAQIREDLPAPGWTAVPGHPDALPGHLVLGAPSLTTTTDSVGLDAWIAYWSTLDAIILGEQAANFGLEAIVVPPAVEVDGSFSLSAELAIGAGMHSREHDHFAEQSDLWITTLDVPGYEDGSILADVLADLFGRASNLTPAFGLDAVIEGVTASEQAADFGLDAVLNPGGGFSMNAVLKHVVAGSYGLSAYVIAP